MLKISNLRVRSLHRRVAIANISIISRPVSKVAPAVALPWMCMPTFSCGRGSFCSFNITRRRTVPFGYAYMPFGTNIGGDPYLHTSSCRTTRMETHTSCHRRVVVLLLSPLGDIRGKCHKLFQLNSPAHLNTSVPN